MRLARAGGVNCTSMSKIPIEPVRMSKTAIRYAFRTEPGFYMEQVVVLDVGPEDRDAASKIRAYQQGLLDLNPGWVALDVYMGSAAFLGSQNADIQELPERSVVWEVYYESELSEAEFCERKYGPYS